MTCRGKAGMHVVGRRGGPGAPYLGPILRGYLAADELILDTERAIWESAFPETDAPLPEHETAVCPRCSNAGVMIRLDECTCCRCQYRWRWPAVEMGLD